MMPSAADVLARAAEYLKADPAHWQQGAFGYGESHCSIGVITRAYNSLGYAIDNVDAMDSPAGQILSQVVHEHYPGRYSHVNVHGEDVFYPDRPTHIPSWNDASERQYEEIVAMFEKAHIKASEMIT